MKERTIAVADCETNKFDKGVTVIPFTWGFYDGSEFLEFRDNWRKGVSGTELFLAYLRNRTDPCIIYAHNGGKFDWLLLAQELRGAIKTIGNRVVKAFIGVHELRDSFANIPVPLRDFGNKIEFDYNILSPSLRDKPANRALITEYLKQDCVGLWLAVVRYRDMFGDSLTMASAAMKKLNEACTGSERTKIYDRLTPEQDASLRPFYYGGRVQCFQIGRLPGAWKVYDVVSMYPSVMQQYAHPISSVFSVREGPRATLNEDTDFLEIDATTKTGCLPLRSHAGLAFPPGRNTFLATGPEVRCALGLGILELHAIKKTITAHERVHFKTFVDQYFALRQQAKSADDKALVLFYKLVMNSAYGKFAINPEKYCDMMALPEGERPKEECFNDEALMSLPECIKEQPCSCNTCFRNKMAWRHGVYLPGVVIWERPIQHAKQAYANVATGSSVTAFARAKLMEGICKADNLAYCDTDSLICEGLSDVSFGKNLGDWQEEASGNMLHVAGKKLYVLRDGEKVVKQASKGVRLSAEDIEAVALGETVEYVQDAPVITLDSVQKPLPVRHIKRTANHV